MLKVCLSRLWVLWKGRTLYIVCVSVNLDSSTFIIADLGALLQELIRKTVWE
jgi:hypothetical protein